MHVAGIEWEDGTEIARIVYPQDVLPLSPLTVLFGANDNGKSSTLRVIARQLQGLATRDALRAGGKAILSFADDRPALDALLRNLEPDDDEGVGAGHWAVETLADQPRLIPETPEGLADMLRQAPAFAVHLPTDAYGRPLANGRWVVTLVDSPLHTAEMPSALRKTLARIRQRRWPRGSKPPRWFNPSIVGPPGRPLHLGVLGTTSLPLVPEPLLLPAGINVALKRLEDAVDRARTAFRAWAQTTQVPLELDESDGWIGADGTPDRFVAELTGEFVTASLYDLPDFVRTSYRLDFDSTTPPEKPWATRLNARIAAIDPLREHRTFAEKFPLDQVASGFQLWFEILIWDLIAEVEAATASLEAAACEDLARFLDLPSSPQARLSSNRERLVFNRIDKWRSWFCVPEERAWQLHVLATASRTHRTAHALDACARSVRPRLALIDEPERHLNAAVVKEAAAWLHSRTRAGRLQVVLATHSAAFLSCHGDGVRHVHVGRAAEGLVYTSFSPEDHDALARVAGEMGLDHGEVFGLSNTIVWVEGPMDRAVLEALCGPELMRCGAHIASYGGLGNMRSVLENPISRLPNLRLVVLVDDLSKAQLRRLREDPESVGVADSNEMRRTAELIRQARASDRQIEIASHGAPDIFLALPDHALRAVAKRPWPGKREALRQAALEGIAKSKLKGFVAARFGLRVDEAHCRFAAELARRRRPPSWATQLLDTLTDPS